MHSEMDKSAISSRKKLVSSILSDDRVGNNRRNTTLVFHIHWVVVQRINVFTVYVRSCV